MGQHGAKTMRLTFSLSACRLCLDYVAAALYPGGRWMKKKTLLGEVLSSEGSKLHSDVVLWLLLFFEQIPVQMHRYWQLSRERSCRTPSGIERKSDPGYSHLLCMHSQC